MGLRSRRVFTAATDSQVVEAAASFQGLLSSIENPINISVLRIGPSQVGGVEQFGVVQFNDKEKRFRAAPADGQACFSDVPFQGEAQLQFRNSLLLDANLALAMRFSSITGAALYIVYSDTYCCSGFVSFAEGRLNEGLIYGWEGDEILYIFKSGSVREEALTVNPQYGKYASIGVDKYIATGRSYEELLHQFDYSGKSIVRYQLMYQKQLVHPVVLAPF